MKKTQLENSQKIFHRIPHFLPLKNPIYRVTSQTYQSNRSARSESPDEWALSVKKARVKIKRIFWKRRYFALSKTYIIEGLISVVVVRDVMWSKTLAEGSNPWSKFFNFFQKMVVKWPPKNPSSRGSWHNHKISSLDPDGRHQSGAQVLIGHHSWRNQKNLVYGLAKTALKKSI